MHHLYEQLMLLHILSSQRLLNLAVSESRMTVDTRAGMFNMIC